MGSSSGSVIIIGGELRLRCDSDNVHVAGGVSGLFAALKLAENGIEDVTVLEVRVKFQNIVKKNSHSEM